MATTLTAAVEITSQTTIPIQEDVIIAWKTNGEEILGFDIRIGATEGDWDVLNCHVGPMVQQISLPELPKNLTKLYLEFSYTIPAAAMHHGVGYEHVLLSEKPIPIWRK
ncbi:MAG: hypothetical protein P0111_11090 [Nitrospira sp.]|nr:hypothetical protein [Nitrospira sp.]